MPHQFQILLYAMLGFGGLLAIIVFGAGILMIRTGINPQRHVDRVRKRRGIDLMANVADKDVFFRSIRRQSLLGGIVLLVISVAIAVRLGNSIGDFGGDLDSPAELYNRHKVVGELKESVDHLEGTTELLREMIELRQAGKTAEAEALHEQFREKVRRSGDALDRAGSRLEKYRDEEETDRDR